MRQTLKSGNTLHCMQFYFFFWEQSLYSFQFGLDVTSLSGGPQNLFFQGGFFHFFLPTGNKYTGVKRTYLEHVIF